MKREVKKLKEQQEYWIEEGCHIIEIANDGGDEDLSVARARLEPGTATHWHVLDGVRERYIIVSGEGRVEIGEDLCREVEPGDVVRIPENTRQRITNIGHGDLIFFVVCTPPFTKECYISLY